MSIRGVERVRRILVLLILAVLASGCAGQKAYKKGQNYLKREKYDEAVLAYSKAMALHPGNERYAMALERAKLQSSGQHFTKGRRYADSGQHELAIAEFQQTLLLNPANQHARQELDDSVRELRRQQSGPSEIEQLKEAARRKDLGPPRLDPTANIPILLDFKEQEVGTIFEAIGKASGLNYIFDDKVDLNSPLTIDIGNVSLEKALDILMLQTKNFYKVIDEFTLLIAPDTRQKRQEYEDQVIRTFFLSNADTKTVVTLLRSLLQSRQIAENPDLNSVTIKDTPAKVAIAERIIQANDKSKGEVIVDVELLEINTNTTMNIGIDLSSKSMLLQFRDGQARLPVNNLEPLTDAANWTVGIIPSVTLDFLKSQGEAKAIAKPQVRVAEGERAEVLIGDRVPIPTTSFNTSQTVGGNIVPITSFTYQNVGITIQVEPRVHHNKEVTLTVQVEISAVTDTVDAGGGQQQPVIGTRQIQTVIRLRDGETNLLAGLIKTEDADVLTGIPGIMDIPILRRIFGRTTKMKRTTDLILTLTPRIIRIPDITEDDLMTLWVGTEENMKLRGPTRDMLNMSPFARSPGTGAPAQPAPTGGTGGGSVSQVTPSDPTGRDRDAAATTPSRTSSARTPNDPSGQTQPPPNQPAGTAQTPPPAPADPDPDPGDRDEPPEPTGPATVSLIPSQASYRVGETVVVEVRIANGQNVGSVPFHLRYNKQVLQYIQAEEGLFLKSGGSNTVFLANDVGQGGEIVVGLSRMGGGTGATGGGTLGVFRFQAIGAGNAGFAFTGSSVKDPQARNLPAAFAPAAVQVSP